MLVYLMFCLFVVTQPKKKLKFFFWLGVFQLASVFLSLCKIIKQPV